MRAVSNLARGVGASVLAVGLLVGVPILLLVVAGNPLPTKTPNWDNVYWAVRQGDITSTFVIKSMACVVWLAWAQLAWAIVWEIAVNMPTVASGRRRRATPLTLAPASRFAHQLVTAMLVMTAISSAASPAIAQAPALSSLMSPHGSGGAPAAAMVLADAGASTVAAVASPGTGAATYRVLSGDTLWDVAERCLGDGAQVDAIVACNLHLSTSRRLRQGQIIELPAHAHMPQADTDADGHTARSAAHDVVAGDTLWDIVEDHYGTADRTLVVAVAEHNSISDPSLIYPGDVIVFPAGLSAAPRVASTGADKHVVVEGDTLWGILEDHYGTVDNDLVRAVADTNGLETPSLIFPGQQIVLPHDPQHPAPESAPTTPAAVDEEPPEAGAGDAPAAEWTTAPTETEADEPVSPIDHPAASTPSNTSAPQEPPAATPSQPTNHEADRPVSSTPDVTPAPGAAVQRKVDRALPNEQDVEAATSKSPEVVAGSRSDLVSARWLFGSAAATALGLAGAWATLQRLRNRRRRWLDLPDTPSHASPLADEARTQRSIAAVAELVATGRQPSPAALGAVLAGDEITVLFDEPRPEPAPGWESADVGWRRPWGDMAGTPAVFSPGLVTLGATDGGGEILLDLSAVGSVSVRGDGGAVEQLMCSMLWELASQPLDAGVDLHVVGLACAASHMTSSPGKLIDLTTALEVASKPIRTDERLQVFLVDPFGEGSNSALLNPLVAACGRGSGRAVVVAGACEKPGEEVFVPTTVRATWRGHSLRPPQLPDDVDRQLAATLAAVVVGRRNETTVGASSQVFDPEAEAASLRSVAMLTEHDDSPPPATGGQWDGINDQPGREVVGANGRDDDVVADLRARSDAPSEMPDVLLRTTGRQVEIVGLTEPVSSKAELAVAFLLAAAGRELHGSEISRLTGYSIKTLHNSVTAAHPLVDRTNGVMKLREGSWTDHGWATECVRRLAAAIDASDAAAEERWLRSGFDVLHAVEQGPFAVLPTKDRNRRNGVAPWDWVDEYPEDVSARDRAETDLAEAGLAYAELWCSLPVAELVRPTELVSVLCRLAMVVPYAAVTRQVHTSTWSSGAECLLEMAMRVADTDVTLQQRVQRTARVMVARQQLEATDDLADALGL